MAHAEGTLKKPVSAKFTLSVIAIIAVAVSGWIFLKDEFVGDKKRVEVTEAEARPRSYTFPDGENQIKVPLDAGRWSGQVVTPPSSIYRIDPPGSGWVETKFIDGTRTRLATGEPVPYLGIKRGIFRLRGEGGDAIVTIERR